MQSHEILFLVFSYFLGSIPFGSIIFYILEKKDIRKEGSGNIGATNVLRTKGKAAGLATLALDVLKGAVPIIYGFTHFDSPVIILGGGAAAIIGHIFPVFLKFKGGKGVATFAGVFVSFYYPSIILFLGIFLLVLVVTRYVSLGSILGVISVFFLILFTHIAEVSVIVLIVTVLIIIRHSGNIKRLINGEENRLNFKKNG